MEVPELLADELVDLAQVDAGEVRPGQVQAVADLGRRLPGRGLVPDLTAYQEFLCHAGSSAASSGVRQVMKAASLFLKL